MWRKGSRHKPVRRNSNSRPQQWVQDAQLPKKDAWGQAHMTRGQTFGETLQALHGNCRKCQGAVQKKAGTYAAMRRHVYKLDSSNGPTVLKPDKKRME